MKNFSKDSLITFFSEVLIFVFGFIALIILARILGPAGKGIYSLIILIPTLVLTFGSFGIESSNVYFVGSRKYKIQDIVSNSLISAIFLGLILIILFWALFQLDFFKKFIDSNQIPSFYLWIVVFSIPLSLLLSFFKNVIRGKGEITNYNKVKILESILGLAMIIIFLIILKQNISGAVFSYVLSITGAALFAVILVKKITKINFSFNKKLLKDSFFYGGKVYLANTASFLNYRLDMLLIALFLNPIAVGFYSISVGMAEKLFMMPGALATVLFPKISSLKIPEADNFTPKIIRHTFFIMIVSSLMLFFLAKPLIILFFGSVFLPSLMPLIILLPGIIAFGVGGVLAADLAGRGKPQFAVYSSLACLAINVPLNIILIPKWGISGAAVASAIAYCVDTLIVLIAFLKISKKPLAEILLIKKQDFEDYFHIFLNLKDNFQKKFNKNKLW
ncbi:MAG TPA: flippase [Candidatus Paceibacterota bacterium]|nr:flippase [Candidatus Paceibacterota bacterium]